MIYSLPVSFEVLKLDRSWLFLLLLLLAISSAWLLWQVQSTLHSDNSQLSQAPLLTIRGLLATSTDQAGEPHYTLSARYAERLPGERGSRLEKPLLVSYGPNRVQVWTASAQSAWAAADNSVIRLQQAVRLVRANAAVPLTITTTELTIFPQQQQVETNQLVRLQSPAGDAEALGLKGYLDHQRLELLAAVKAVYAPP